MSLHRFLLGFAVFSGRISLEVPSARTSGGRDRHPSASLSRLGETDRDRLLAAAHTCSGPSGFELAALHLVQCALDFLPGFFPVAPGLLASRHIRSRLRAARAYTVEGVPDGLAGVRPRRPRPGVPPCSPIRLDFGEHGPYPRLLFQ